ncbi:MAG: LacI family transcriptional regulator [Lachnospiraceae bacterium]|jgi:LacI family transcriptional regulator|nr:LacI family transcriptional regulator [Lachnospiraceae bacterium]
MITIKELAKECGVSIATVSNVLNGTGRVGEDTIKKVLQTASRLGYVPNEIAKNLKQGTNRTIGVITEDLTVFNAVEIVDGINEYLNEKDYSFLLGNLRLCQQFGGQFYHVEEYKQQVLDQFQLMWGRQVAGIIYVGSHSRKMTFLPENRSVPLIMVYAHGREGQFTSVVFDDFQGAYDAVMKLHQSGAKRIGILAGDKESEHSRARVAGCKQAYRELGREWDESLVLYGGWLREYGYRLSGELMQKHVDSVFCMSDEMAAGVYDYMHEHHIVIGKQLRLVGFDNRLVAEAYSPGLATMAIPLRGMGQTAARLLLERLNGRETLPEGQMLRLKCHYVDRPSIGQ